MLNVLSLFTSGCAAFLLAIYTVFTWAKIPDIVVVIDLIYNAYFLYPQYTIVIFSSNIAFIVHCCYSKMYREASLETFAAFKASCKRAFNIISKQQPKVNAVKPEHKYTSTYTTINTQVSETHSHSHT
jgi:hypothetical protein